MVTAMPTCSTPILRKITPTIMVGCLGRARERVSRPPRVATPFALVLCLVAVADVAALYPLVIPVCCMLSTKTAVSVRGALRIQARTKISLTIRSWSSTDCCESHRCCQATKVGRNPLSTHQPRVMLQTAFSPEASLETCQLVRNGQLFGAMKAERTSRLRLLPWTCLPTTTVCPVMVA